MADDIGTQLMENLAPTASEAPVAQEPVVEAPVEQAPAFDPTQFDNQFASQSDQIAQIAQQMEQLGTRIPEQQAPAPTEQEVIAQELKKQLGIDGLENKLGEQASTIEQQNQMLQQFQQMQQQAQAEKAFTQLETEFGAIDKTVLQNKIVEISQSNPALAEALNSPEGARMLLAQGVGVVTATPDQITPSSNNTDVGSDNTLDRIRDGKASQEDFGQAFMDFLK